MCTTVEQHQAPETRPDALDPAEMLRKGVYDNADPTALGALWASAEWILTELERNAPADEFAAKVTYIRTYTEALMDARLRRAES